LLKKILFWTNSWFFKAVGFVDCAFAILYDENLENHLSLTNVDGNTHVVIYKKKLEKPLLIEGWYDLKSFYKLQHDHCIYFGYVGNSCFQITTFPGKCEPLCIGRFYSRIM